MAVCVPPLSDVRAERTLTEVNQELRLQLAKCKQDFRDLTEKFLVSEATAYSLANQLQKYKCGAYNDIVESVLGEKLPFEVPRPAEKPTLDERLRTCEILIRSQARELTQLRQTLQDGKDDSVLLRQHLKDLLTHNDLDKHQGQGFRESLSEGYRLAERLACKLSPEICEDEEAEQAQETLTPSMELQEAEKKEVPEESKDECALMPSIFQGSSDSPQPRSDDTLKFNELEVDLGPDGAAGCSHAKEDEIPSNISDNENHHKQVSGQELSFPSVNLLDVEKQVVFQQSQDECVSVPSTLQEGSACNQPSSDGKFAFDEENVESAMDGACGCSHAEEDEISTGLPENQNGHDDLKGAAVVAPRFNRQLPQMIENGVPQDSLDEHYLTYSVLPDLSDSFWPYRSNAIFSPEDVDVSYARDVTNNENDHKQVSGQELSFPSVNLLDVEKQVVFQQSQDECVSVPSTLQEGSACNQPSSDGKFAFDEENVESAMDGACGCSHAEEDEISTGLPENQNGHDDLKGAAVVAPRFNRQLPQMIENGVPQDSLDEHYLTYSVLPDLSDSFWPYRSNAIFSPEDVDVSYARDVTNNENDHKQVSGQELSFPSVNLLDVEKQVVFQQSQDECVSVPSTLQEGSACNQPSSDGKFAFDEENVESAMDGACGCSHAEEDEISTGLPENQNGHDDLKGAAVVAPRFNRQLPQMIENGVPQDSLDEHYLTYSVLPDLSDSFWPYRSNAIFSPEDVDVSYARDVTNNENDHKQVSGQELSFPSVNLLDVEKQVVFQQSQDECVSVPSTLQEGSACNQPSSDGKFAFDEENVESAMDGACGCSHAEEDEISTGLPENQNGHDDLKGAAVVAPRFNRQLPQMIENGVPQDSLDEHYLTYSVLPDLSDSFWPYRSNAIFSPEDVDVSYARDVTNNENDHKQVSGQELSFPSVNLLDVEKQVVFQQSQDECVSVPSTLQEGSACNQPSSDGKFAFDEENVESAMDGACGCSHAEEDEISTGLPENQNGHDDLKGAAVVAPRFNRQLPQMIENGVPQDSLDEHYLTYSVLPDLSDSFWPYRSNAIFSPEDVDVFYARDVTNNENDHKQMSGQELSFPSVNLLDVEKKVVFQQSQDECVSVPSTLQEGSACNQPSSDGKFAFDEENGESAMDGACGCSHAEEDEIPTGLPENQNGHDDLKGAAVVAPRFNRQLPQMIENGVPQDSLDEHYLTYSVLPDLSDSFWPYRSNAIFSPEDVDVSYARDVTKNLADLEDKEDQDIICSSMDQLVVEENEVQPDSLDECYLAASSGHHLTGSCHPYRSASFPTETREDFLDLGVNGDPWVDCHQGPVSFPGSEVQTPQAQLQESTHVTNCLQRQLDQHFDCGDSKAMLGLSSTTQGFPTNPDSGNQGPLFLELDASIRMKNPPKLEGEGAAAGAHVHPVCSKMKCLSVLKEKIIKRKLLFGKWRLACRFPGLQA